MTLESDSNSELEEEGDYRVGWCEPTWAEDPALESLRLVAVHVTDRSIVLTSHEPSFFADYPLERIQFVEQGLTLLDQ